MSPTKGTPVRTLRVSDELWDAATKKAGDEGTNLGEVLRAALEQYVDGES